MLDAKQKQQGFTIVELLVVIVVIAILAAVSVVSYNGIIARANYSLVASDMRSNLTRVKLFQAETGRMPSSNDLSDNQAKDYKLKISKRSAYTFFGYCSGSLNGKIEIIMTVGMPGNKQFYLSSQENSIVDVSEDLASLPENGNYQCWEYLRPGSQRGEFRNVIHRSGAIEGGYVTIESQ